MGEEQEMNPGHTCWAPQRPPFPAAVEVISEKDPGSRAQERQTGQHSMESSREFLEAQLLLDSALGLRSPKRKMEVRAREIEKKMSPRDQKQSKVSG